ncbi:hypothetical protein B0H12DRAFT_1127621 [Mycena haematopus]|nr:hypothetical protein B0H12DRAFT_1127621 [Mycena haematopus]
MKMWYKEVIEPIWHQISLAKASNPFPQSRQFWTSNLGGFGLSTHMQNNLDNIQSGTVNGSYATRVAAPTSTKRVSILIGHLVLTYLNFWEHNYRRLKGSGETNRMSPENCLSVKI